MKGKSPLEREKTRLRAAIRYFSKCMREDSCFEGNHWRERRIAELKAELKRIKERENE